MNVWPYPCRVAGVSFRMKDNRELMSDDVWIERIRNNASDPWAIGVWNVKERAHLFIGYLPREISAHITDDQLPTWGKIVWRAAEGLGVRVQI